MAKIGKISTHFFGKDGNRNDMALSTGTRSPSMLQIIKDIFYGQGLTYARTILSQKAVLELENASRSADSERISGIAQMGIVEFFNENTYQLNSIFQIDGIILKVVRLASGQTDFEPIRDGVTTDINTLAQLFDNSTASNTLLALCEIINSNNEPYIVGRTYMVGDTFTIGGVTHIVIPEADGLTAKFSDAVGAFTGLTIEQEQALSNKRTGYITSLKAGYERFRAEAVPLHLYEKGISSPVVDGINLTDKYPKFFANCNGLNASGQYNTARKTFIDDNLPYLATGGVYKTFNVPQGFGIVNNANGIGTTTGGEMSEHTHFDGILTRNNTTNNDVSFMELLFPFNALNSNTSEGSFRSKSSQVETGDTEEFKLRNGNINFKANATTVTTNGTEAGAHMVAEKNNNEGFWMGAKMEKYNYGGGTIDYNTTPVKGAGLQLGYYTLLKMV